jgi:hypothetical protein
LSLGGFDPHPLRYNDLVNICPSVAYIRHRLHYVPINHVNNFFIITTINHLNDFLPNGIYYHYSFLHTFKIHNTKLSISHICPRLIYAPTHAYIRNILLLQPMFP